MSRLILSIFITFIVASDSDPITITYQVPMPIAPANYTEKKVDSVAYMHIMEGHHTDRFTGDEKVRTISQAYIECVPGESEFGAKAIHDKPLAQAGWLYGDDIWVWMNYFDTGVKEHWVFPNVYCNSNRILTAMSWKRSNDDWEHHKMHSRFRNRNPPDYDEEILRGHDRRSVYCSWNGWLFPTGDHHYSRWVDTKNRDELFSLVNVYCDANQVRYFHHKFAGAHDMAKGDSTHPFKNLKNPTLNNTTTVGCNWNGWLYKATSAETWYDRDDDKNKQRWSYERYFAIDNKNTYEKGKRDGEYAIHGRVMNPFCSKTSKNKKGIVTQIRAYCFYPSSGEWSRTKESFCADLK